MELQSAASRMEHSNEGLLVDWLRTIARGASRLRFNRSTFELASADVSASLRKLRRGSEDRDCSSSIEEREPGPRSADSLGSRLDAKLLRGPTAGEPIGTDAENPESCFAACSSHNSIKGEVMNPTLVADAAAAAVQLYLQIQQIRSTNPAAFDAVYALIAGQVKTDVASLDAAVAAEEKSAAVEAPAVQATAVVAPAQAVVS